MHAPAFACPPQACPTAPLAGGVVLNNDVGRALRSALEKGLAAVSNSISSVSMAAGTARVASSGSSGASVQTTYSITGVRQLLLCAELGRNRYQPVESLWLAAGEGGGMALPGLPWCPRCLALHLADTPNRLAGALCCLLQSTMDASAYAPGSTSGPCDGVADCTPSSGQCQPGRYLAAPTLCGLCPAGSSCAGGAAAPAACPPGYFAGAAGAAACAACPADSYQQAGGRSWCDDCPANSYAHFEGSTG